MVVPNVKQGLTDDSAGCGTIANLYDWYKHLSSEGRKYGYLVNGQKKQAYSEITRTRHRSQYCVCKWSQHNSRREKTPWCCFGVTIIQISILQRKGDAMEGRNRNTIRNWKKRTTGSLHSANEGLWMEIHVLHENWIFGRLLNQFMKHWITYSCQRSLETTVLFQKNL